MAPNSSGVESIPVAATASSNCWLAAVGGWPLIPPSTGTFCAAIASRASWEVSPRAASCSGSSQIRIE